MAVNGGLHRHESAGASLWDPANDSRAEQSRQPDREPLPRRNHSLVFRIVGSQFADRPRSEVILPLGGAGRRPPLPFEPVRGAALRGPAEVKDFLAAADGPLQ